MPTMEKIKMIQIALTQKEYNLVKSSKNELTWRQYIMSCSGFLIPAKSNKKEINLMKDLRK